MKMQEIVVTEVEDTGCIIGRPITLDDENHDNPYGDFLSSLNTYYENRKLKENYVPETGQSCACYVKVGDVPGLWYRAQVVTMFKSSGGYLGKLWLVDEGRIVCVTKLRMRPLASEFTSFPHQVMKCVFNNLVPITLSAGIDLRMTMQKSQKWDQAGISFIQEIIRDSKTAVESISVDSGGVHRVIFYFKKGNTEWMNLNEILIAKSFAVKQDTGVDTIQSKRLLAEQPKIFNENGTEAVDTSQKPVEAMSGQPECLDVVTSDGNNINSDVWTAFASVQTSVMNQQKLLSTNKLDKMGKDEREDKKRQQQLRLKENASKEALELLGLISDDVPDIRSPIIYKSNSETSDLSDMESTPVPQMTSFKYARSKLDPIDLLRSKLGDGDTDLLARGFGLSRGELPESTRITQMKDDTFSSNDETCQENVESNVPFQFNEMPCVEQDEANPGSRLVGASYVMQAISAGRTKLIDSGKADKRRTKYDDVLVYGKLRRAPYTDFSDLNIPLPIKEGLKAMGFKEPTPLQAHMWPALDAMAHIVGITESHHAKNEQVTSYIVPLLKHLLSSQLYGHLPRGNGPIVIICVAGWEEAQLVYDVCEKLATYYRKKIRIDVRYGGMDNEEERNIRLLNGCEILIATIPSLNKMADATFTNFSRTCHIIFDDADILVEKFTEDIKIMMRQYAEVLIKQNRVDSSHIVAVGSKWSYGIASLMRTYLMDPVVIIANKIEAALFAKVPIVVEVCAALERLEHLVGFLETDAANKNTIVFTNSAKSADSLRDQLKQYSICVNVITEFTTPSESKDIKTAWKLSMKTNNNVLVISDNAACSSRIHDASYVVHYDYPQKKSHFGNRLNCLMDTIRDNESHIPPKALLSHVFVTEQDNSMRYSTGLVKILKRSGQAVPELLRSLAISSRELKEEQKQYYELCPRLKLFGECSFIDDCMERHTIFPERDLLGVYPSTGFVKVIILDVISASNFWGRIIEHRLPYDKNNTAYDTNIYLQLSMDLQLYYLKPENCKICYAPDKYEVCVTKTEAYGYQRVQIKRVDKDELNKCVSFEVFGIDNGFTMVVPSGKLLLCAKQFTKIPQQAVEIITCCVKPPERGTSWTIEASRKIESMTLGKTLEGRVQFSLQNTVWVDPLVEKEVLPGIQVKTYSFDVGRELLRLGFAEKNYKHVEHLRKLLYDVQGHPIELTDAKSSLPLPMLEHDVAYLHDEDYEDVYVSAVVNPGLFFVQRISMSTIIDNLDSKIDATMSVKKPDPDLDLNVFPIGYICVAQFTVDKRWYRAKVLGMDSEQTSYDIFYVDHGDREWLPRSRVAPSWSDVLTLPFQAIQCSFTKITPVGCEWTDEDGDILWDIVEQKLLSAKVLRTKSSGYLEDTICYEVELYDTTGEQNKYISHELVYHGVALGSTLCLQEMFPHASISNTDQIYKLPCDRCPDLCVEIHLAQDEEEKISKVENLNELLKDVTLDPEVLIENGSVQSICKLLALTKLAPVQDKLLRCLQNGFSANERCSSVMYESDLLKVICSILTKTSSETLQTTAITSLMACFRDSWYHHVLHDLGMMRILCDILQSKPGEQVLGCCLDAIVMFCDDNESNCAAIRQDDGLESLCKLFTTSTNPEILEKCADALNILLQSSRNQDRIREIGGLQDLSSMQKNYSEKTLTTVLKTLLLCLESNDANRDYLHKINAQQNIRRCAVRPVRYGIAVRRLFDDVIKKIEDVPEESEVSYKHDDEDMKSSFMNRLIVDEDKDESQIINTVSPTVGWSQRKNTVILAVKLRGVKRQETDFHPDRIHFRTVLEHVEYILDLELYDQISTEESNVLVKGGEVLITLYKKISGEEWPRLTMSTDKLAYVRVDFDRWDDDLVEVNATPTDDDCILFKPSLPAPPKCSSYDPATATVACFDDGTESESRSDESDNENDFDYRADTTCDDYFKI